MKRLRIPIILSLLIGLFVSTFSYAGSVSSYQDMKLALTGKSSKQKIQAIEWLSSQPDQELSHSVLQAWLDGELYYDQSLQQLFVISKLAETQTAHNVQTDERITITNTRQYKKVRINNRLRKEVRSELAQIGLSSKDDSIRLQAVQSLIGNTDEQVIEAIRIAIDSESVADIKKEMTLAISAYDALANNPEVQLAAIEQLSGYKHAIVFSRLNEVIRTSSYEESIAAAEKGIDQYQQSQRLYSGIETAFFGLSMGSILVLAAIGLAITFGVMGVINMAHGELIMIGAYTTYVMQLLMPNHLGLSLALSIPMAFLVSGSVGIAIERGVIRHLYGRPLETLLATFGLSLILQQAIRSIFSPLNRSVATPDFMSGVLQINPMLSFTYNRLYIVLFCFAVFLALVVLLKKTPLGLQVRAVSQNRSMAKAMGIRSERVDAMTFGLGSGVAGVAGVALSQLTNVGPNMGQAYIIDSFMVVVFGGVGNLWGTLVAGLGLGIFNKVLEPWAGAVLAKILVLVFIILFIQKRPRGLFPQRGRAAES